MEENLSNKPQDLVLPPSYGEQASIYVLEEDNGGKVITPSPDLWGYQRFG